MVPARKETCADAVSDRAQSEIKTCRLDLLFADFLGGENLTPRPDQTLDHVARQDSGRMLAVRAFGRRGVARAIVKRKTCDHGSNGASHTRFISRSRRHPVAPRKQLPGIFL